MTKEDQDSLIQGFNSLGCLYQDFVRVAKLYTEVIVSELFLSEDQKTLHLVKVGGLAVGDKVYD